MIRLALVGAGHTHLHLVTAAAALRSAGIEPTVLAPPHFSYSGMGSAVAGGAVGPAANRVDVERLCRRHDVSFVPGRVTGLDDDERILALDDGRTHPTDWLSLNVGSEVATGGVEVDGDVVAVKPLVGLAGLPHRLDALPRDARVVVVGGGASAIEVASNLAARAGPGVVDVLGRPQRPVPVGSDDVRAFLVDHLARLGVTWQGGVTVTRAGRGRVHSDDDRAWRADVVVLATGLRPSSTIAALGLAGDDGHLPVDAHLGHPGLDWVFGAGDGVRFLPRPLPKIGVYGVRAGPVLVDVLRARARGTTPPAFEPQQDFLAILDLATTGLAVRGGRWWHGRSALLLKRAIDRRWLARYRTGN